MTHTISHVDVHQFLKFTLNDKATFIRQRQLPYRLRFLVFKKGMTKMWLDNVVAVNHVTIPICCHEINFEDKQLTDVLIDPQRFF